MRSDEELMQARLKALALNPLYQEARLWAFAFRKEIMQAYKDILNKQSAEAKL